MRAWAASTSRALPGLSLADTLLKKKKKLTEILNGREL